MAKSRKKTTTADGEEPDWKTSKAKVHLFTLLVKGIVDVNGKRDPRKVFDTHCKNHPSFAEFSYENFPARLRALRIAIKERRERAEDDELALAHDRLIHPKPTHDVRGYPQWDGHEAHRLLKEDIDNGLHKQMKPKELWDTRDEYKEFPLDVFRKHIHQEVTSRKFRAQYCKGVRVIE